MGTEQGKRTRPWRLVALGAIGWGLFTAVVLHIISSHNPVYDTLSSYTVTDRGEGMLAASVLSLAIGSLAVLGALHAAGVPLSRTTRCCSRCGRSGWPRPRCSRRATRRRPTR